MLIICLLTGCTAGTAVAETVNNKFNRVIALSRSNAELWILAGGKLIGASDDAVDINGLNEDVQFLGDMDHVSLEAIAALSPDLLILFSTEPAQKALGEAAEGIGITVYYTNIDSFDDYDYMVIAEEIAGSEAVDKIIHTVTTAALDYTGDPAVMEAARDALAEIIVNG